MKEKSSMNLQIKALSSRQLKLMANIKELSNFIFLFLNALKIRKKPQF